MKMKIKKVLEFLYIKCLNNAKYVDYLKKKGVRIGTGCNIDKSANFGSEPWLITIGDNVRITRGVEMITHDGGVWTLRKMGRIDSQLVKYGRIVIGNNCNISWNAIIMPGVIIGDNCIVAAGAIVTHDVPSGTIVGGVPARIIETVDEYYDKIMGSPNVFDAFSLSNEEKKKMIAERKPEWFH